MIHYARTGRDLLVPPRPYIKLTIGMEDPWIQVVSEADMTEGSIPEISILTNSPAGQKPFTVVESRFSPDRQIPVSYRCSSTCIRILLVMVTEIDEFLDILPVHFVIRETDLVLRTIDNLNFFREQKLLDEVQKLHCDAVVAAWCSPGKP